MAHWSPRRPEASPREQNNPAREAPSCSSPAGVAYVRPQTSSEVRLCAPGVRVSHSHRGAARTDLSDMPLTRQLRRAVAPAIVIGLTTTSVVGVVGVATPSASALDAAPASLAVLAPTAAAITSPVLAAPAIASPAADLVVDDSETAAERAAPAADRERPRQRLLPRVRLKALPAPWVLPVSGYHLTGRFGQSSGLWSSTHTGLDFAAPQGTEIRSIGPGVVVSAAFDGAFGNKTVVRLDDGTVLWYCHQSEFGVEPGQRVKPGDHLGSVGSTGNTTGPHLHLEVHPHGGDPIDPGAWLPEHRLHP